MIGLKMTLGKRIKNTLTLTILAATTIAAAPTPSAAKTCLDLFVGETGLTIPPGDLAEQARASYSSPNIKAYKMVVQLRAKFPEIKLQPKLNEAIDKLLLDESLSTFHDTLRSIVTQTLKLHQRTRSSSDKTSSEELLKAMIEVTTVELGRFMPYSQARERALLLKDSNMNKGLLMRALGQMTAKESLEAMIGPNGIRNVSADSLVGRYLSEAKKLGSEVSSYVGRFRRGPGYKDRGPEKLFITVDGKSLPLLNSLFAKNPHMLIHHHDESQGTLEMYHNGKFTHYAAYSGRPTNIRLMGNMILPMMVLSSVEASNAKNYFDLGSLERPRAQYPWALKQIKEDEVRSYCRVGGYSSCTHWVGEMPIGEKLVTEYTFPGRGSDPYSDPDSTRDPLAKNQRTPRTGAIGDYNSFVSYTTTYKIGYKSRTDRLTRLVWGENQGREQLWSMLGPEGYEALTKGELANPGWVLYTLLSRATTERVPVVFVFRDFEYGKLDQSEVDELRRSINPQ